MGIRELLADIKHKLADLVYRDYEPVGLPSRKQIIRNIQDKLNSFDELSREDIDSIYRIMVLLKEYPDAEKDKFTAGMEK